MQPLHMSVSDYVIKSEQLYFKIKLVQMELLDDVLAFGLLSWSIVLI